MLSMLGAGGLGHATAGGVWCWGPGGKLLEFEDWESKDVEMGSGSCFSLILGSCSVTHSDRWGASCLAILWFLDKIKKTGLRFCQSFLTCSFFIRYWLVLGPNSESC